MPILKSLICLAGYDTGRRFLSINFVCYLLLVLLNAILSKSILVVAVYIAFVVPILTATSIRRVRDSGFSQLLIIIPIFNFAINFYGIVYTEQTSRWALLILAAITTLGIASISHVRMIKRRSYQMGYNGPVNLKGSSDDEFHYDRVEPTIANQANESPADTDFFTDVKESIQINPEDFHAQREQPATLEKSHPLWGYPLGDWLTANKKASLLALVLMITGLIVAIFWSPSEDSPTTNDLNMVETTKRSPTKSRLNKIEMPDNFWVMLDQNDALTVAWESDTNDAAAEEQNYWSAITGKGDKDCLSITFNGKLKYKTMQVTVKNAGDYYADFSPADTVAIVKAIANKDKFSLCGYHFKLQGTGSLLRKNTKYYQYLTSS